MADQYRDTCVDKQNKKRKVFAGNSNDPIRVSFYDKDGTKVNDVTRSEANCIARTNPAQLFYFQDGNGYQRELLIKQVNELSIINDTLPVAPSCPTDPQFCGPPRVKFYGGTGIGAMANAVISPNSSSVIGFDIVNPGFNYLTPPSANIVDECGSGSGASLRVQVEPYKGSTGIGSTTINLSGTNTAVQSDVGSGKGGYQIKNIVVTSPGDGYLSAPNGSLGGNGRIWKNVNEGYVKKSDGSYYVVKSGVEPPELPVGDEFVPPKPSPEITKDVISYPVVTEIEEVYVEDPGFGYEPGDTLEVVPSNGAVLEPVINDRGEITKVKVIQPGIGFIDLPEININSPRGYNAKLLPVLRVIPIADIPDPTVIPPGTQLISVVDCVGKIAPKTEFDIVPR